MMAITAFLSYVAIGMQNEGVSKEDIFELVDNYVKERSVNGVFIIRHPVTGKKVELVYIGPRSLYRRIHGYGYFIDVYFHEKGNKQKKYDIDFWIKKDGGKLVVVDVRVHKYPEKIAGEWFMTTVSPLPWWWKQSSGEHGGEPFARGDWRAWAVKAAINEYVAKKIKEEGAFRIKDPVTGKTVSLELVAIHDPVRKFPKKGLYFACGDFRPIEGPGGRLYDIDIFLKNTGKDGSLKLQVVDVKVHKVPVFKNGRWIKKALFYYKGEDIVELP